MQKKVLLGNNYKLKILRLSQLPAEHIANTVDPHYYNLNSIVPGSSKFCFVVTKPPSLLISGHGKVKNCVLMQANPADYLALHMSIEVTLVDYN